MKAKAYELILLDADGTLLDYDRTEALALELSFRGAGIEYRKDAYLPRYREVNDKIWKEFENGLITAAELRVERFRRFFSLVGLEADPAPFGKAYVENLAEGGFLFDEAQPLLERLKPRFKLGLVTNGLKEVQRKRFAMTPSRTVPRLHRGFRRGGGSEARSGDFRESFGSRWVIATRRPSSWSAIA